MCVYIYIAIVHGIMHIHNLHFICICRGLGTPRKIIVHSVCAIAESVQRRGLTCELRLLLIRTSKQGNRNSCSTFQRALHIIKPQEPFVVALKALFKDPKA